VVDLLKNARQPMFTVCLSDAIQRVLAPEQVVNSRGGVGSTLGVTQRRRPPIRDVAHAAARQNGPVRHLKERGGKAS